MRLNLGCGLDILPGWVNVDASEALRKLGAEIWDLDEIPWAFAEDGSASEIRGIDIFEHVHDHTGFMTECHRILAPGGTLYLQTTWIESMDSFTDPDHTCHPTPHTFDYWVPGNVLYETQNVTKGGVSFLYRGRPALNPQTGQMDVWMVKPDA